MKKVILFSVLIILIAAACTKKAIPITSGAVTSPTKTTVTEKKSEADKASEVGKPSEAVQPLGTKDPAAPAAPNKPSEEETGKNVFTAKCGKCHALKNVGSFSFTQWEGILKTMVPRAKLTADEENQVVAYIKANSK